jgi:flagellar basal body-associated protein FliL
MTKTKASLIHFLISFLIISTFLIFVYFVWYDQIFVELSGVIEPAKMLILVDVVLGPLLTFIIYQQGKKNLKLDLSLIVLVQLMAFAYGAYTLFMGKPSLVIMKGNVMEVVIQKQVESDQLPGQVQQDFNPLLFPYYARITEDQLNLFTSASAQQAQLEPLDFSLTEVQDKALSMDHVKQHISDDLSLLVAGTALEQMSAYLLIDNEQYAVLMVSPEHQPAHISLTDEGILNFQVDQ